ncbi:MAG: plasmid pRiA4b ORF-3 family protein [Gemmatimonadota bacterium]
MAANAQIPKRIYRLKVSLRDIKPPIWRKLEVPAELSLGQLHRVLQIAMGWTDTHLHQFEHDGVWYGARGAGADMEVQNEQRTRLAELIQRPKERLRYEYDFGDGWEHDIVLEAVVDSTPGVRYPRVINGARACPPEDVGGPPGYQLFLEAIADPRHPEHREFMEWCGGRFDAVAFHLEEINAALSPGNSRSKLRLLPD